MGPIPSLSFSNAEASSASVTSNTSFGPTTINKSGSSTPLAAVAVVIGVIAIVMIALRGN